MFATGLDDTVLPQSQNELRDLGKHDNSYARPTEDWDIRTPPDITARISLDIGNKSVIDLEEEFYPFLELYKG